jgi:hypothetical protein
VKLRRLWPCSFLVLLGLGVPVALEWHELAVRFDAWRLRLHPELAEELAKKGGTAREAVERVAFDAVLDKRLRQHALNRLIDTEEGETSPERLARLLQGSSGLERFAILLSRFDKSRDPLVHGEIERIAISDEHDDESELFGGWLAEFVPPRTCGEPIAPRLRRIALESRWAKTRALACGGLVEPTPENVATLERALGDREVRVRVKAANMLAWRHASHRGRDACVEALRPGVPNEVELDAVSALSILEDRSVILALARAHDEVDTRPSSEPDRYQLLVLMRTTLESLTGERGVEKWVPWVEAHRSELPEQTPPP